MRQKVLLQMWEDWNTCRCPYFPNNFAQNLWSQKFHLKLQTEELGFCCARYATLDSSVLKD
jgi:hypothetical protein